MAFTDDRKTGEGWEDPAQLLAHPDNPKIHPMGQTAAVKAAIRDLGWMAKIKVNSRTGFVIDGHDRIKAAMQEGVERVPVEYYDLSEEEEKLFLVTYDPIGTLFASDRELTAKLLQDVNTGEADLMQFLSDQAEELGIVDFGPESESLDAEPDVSRADELQAEWGTALGQVWRLPSRTEGQEHRLICGDSAKESTVFNFEYADMMITDPPYGVAYVGKTKDALTIESDSVSESELEELVGSWFDVAERMCKGGAYWIATVPPGPLHSVFLLDWKERGILRQIMVWVKDSLVLGHSEYHYRHEPILFGWKPGERRKNSDRTRTTVWEFDRPKASRLHPTMKPVEMWEYGIKNHSDAGDVVYEPFSGSGTTLIACENLSRQCRAVEISPAYVAVALQRYFDAFGIKPELIEGQWHDQRN